MLHGNPKFVSFKINYITICVLQMNCLVTLQLLRSSKNFKFTMY